MINLQKFSDQFNDKMNSGRRPNRGGRFNKPRGGSGGGSRKGLGKAWDDGDDFSFSPKPAHPTRPRGRGRGGARGRGRARGGGRSRAGSRAGGASRKCPEEEVTEQGEFNLFGNLIKSQRSNQDSQKGGMNKAKSESRVPLQTINMTAENQKEVKQLLQELQVQDKEAAVENEDSEEEYDLKEELDGLDNRYDDQYWSTKEEGLAVAENTSLVYLPVEQQTKLKQPEFSPFAVWKLTRFIGIGLL